MTHDTIPPFAFPAVRGRKITADFDGGRLTSNGGVMLLAIAKRRLGIAARLARLVPDRRDPARVTHTLVDMIRARRLSFVSFVLRDGPRDQVQTHGHPKLCKNRVPARTWS